MESRPPPKNQQTEERPEGLPRKPLRFRVVRLEERIAPGNTTTANSRKCFLSYFPQDCVSMGGCYPSW